MDEENPTELNFKKTEHKIYDVERCHMGIIRQFAGGLHTSLVIAQEEQLAYHSLEDLSVTNMIDQSTAFSVRDLGLRP